MIDRQTLLSDLQELLKTLEADLLERSELSEPAEVASIGERLRAEHARAREAERTALSWIEWRDAEATQVAAAWVLSCVFGRFLEDNELVDPPRLSGPGERLQRARDERTAFFRSSPTETDREYLLDVFDTLTELPAANELFGDQNPLRDEPNWLSGDAASELLQFFQMIDANSGALVHDFTDPDWGTRFLGDLYQDLSEAARKRYALLQTPDFVEEFILDRTLEPALNEFGLNPGGVLAEEESQQPSENRFKMIDPACGSGHFLLGAFDRLLDRWQRQEPATPVRTLVQRALDSVHGVDVNPYAVAIARFRLLLSAMKASGVERLQHAPSFNIHLACGDSLYHGKAAPQQMLGDDWTDESHYFHTENAAELRRLLKEGTYHCVVANPPYITPKDKAANQAYRKLYESCHMKYSLAAPFMERIFRLAIKSDGNGQSAGYTGQITANSFMKREFGKKIIEQYLPKIDLTHVVDTSGAYIPGHGTPTVILFGRNQKPLSDTVRAVMGIRGEPATPDDPAQGLVWTAISDQIDHPGSESEYVSVGDTERERLAGHPWSIGGGGAAELKDVLDSVANQSFSSAINEIGFFGITAADDVMYAPESAFHRSGVSRESHRPLIVGDEVRDWFIAESDHVLFPYQDEQLITLENSSSLYRWLWPYKTTLWARSTFSRMTYRDEGRPWWEWHQIALDRIRTPLSIVYAEVATHNHFVLDRGGKVFKQTAPVIKLPENATEEDYLALLGLLNSSVACFWIKQVCHNKGAGGGTRVQAGKSTMGDDLWECHYALNGTALKGMPIVNGYTINRSSNFVRTLAEAKSIHGHLEIALTSNDGPQSAMLSELYQRVNCYFKTLIGFQEELDWVYYSLYGLTESALSCERPEPLEPGQRAFEIVLARKVAAGELETTWFERHGSLPITELPDHWSDEYKQLVEKRIELIETDRNIGLIERPEYKRRWSTEPWEEQVEEACENWLLERLESYFDFDGRMACELEASAPAANNQFGIEVVSIGRLTDIARADEQFQEIGAVYTGDQAFDVTSLVEDLVRGESVPLLPVLRYKPSGLRKRAAWEETWELQRREDAGEEVGDIPVPPKYKSSDFISTGGARYWALRGKLDVPKERWLSFPHCDAADGTPAIAWAGLDHLQLAQAVAEFYVDIKERQGGSEDDRLIPLLGCLLELIPWLKQWHNDLNPEYNLHMGDYYEGFISDEASQLGLTTEQIKVWAPPKKKTGKRRKQTT